MRLSAYPFLSAALHQLLSDLRARKVHDRHHDDDRRDGGAGRAILVELEKSLAVNPKALTANANMLPGYDLELLNFIKVRIAAD